MKTLMIFRSGMVAAFEDGRQVPELQAKSLLELWADRASALGYDPTEFVVSGLAAVIVRDSTGKFCVEVWR